MAPQNWGSQSDYHWGSEVNLERTKQIDLEDQIEEEYRAQGRVYERTSNNNQDMSTSQQPRIVVQDVLDLLKKGYTRRKKDDMGYGSIEEHYNLTLSQVKELFSHPKLHMKKTIAPKLGLIIVDDDEVIDCSGEELEGGNLAPMVDSMLPMEELPDAVARVIAEAKQDVEVKSAPAVKREELFS